MKAAVLYHPGRPLAIEDVDLAPPKAGEVRVRICAAGICHSDLHYMKGDLPTRLPVVLGHEGAGIVEEVGPGVTSLFMGDRVVLLWRTSCGRCGYCSSGRPVLCPLGARIRSSGYLGDGSSRLNGPSGEIHHFLGVSCFAEKAVVSEYSAMRIPTIIPFTIAALVGCAVMTGYGAVVNTARVEPGSTVLVIGAGGIGLSIILGSILAGAGRIIVADIGVPRLRFAEGLGATDTIDVASQNVVAETMQLTGGGVDYAFEAVGSPETIRDAVRALKPGGIATAVGLSRPDAKLELNPLDLVLAEKTLKGSIYGSSRPQVDFPRIFNLYSSGRLPLDRLVSREYRLDDIESAYDAMQTGAVARSIVIPNDH